MNLLVTGGAGFIGSIVIRHVIDKPEVARLVNLDCLTYAGHLANLEGVRGKAPDAAQDLTDQSGSQERRTACLVSGATVSEPVLGLALSPAR